MNQTPSELLKLCVARARQDAAAVFVGDEMPKGMQGGMKSGKGGMNGGGEGGGGAMDESNAQEESLDEHIKHWHKGVPPSQPCAWMIKHGYGQQQGGVPNKQGNGGQTGNAAGKNFDPNVQMTPVTGQEIKQSEGELKKNNGELGLKTQQGADNVAQIEQLYRQAKTPEQKKAIDRIYKNLQKSLGRNPTDGEFSDAHKADVEKGEQLKKEVADENARIAQEEADNKRADGLRKEKQAHLKERISTLKADYKSEFDNLVYLTKHKDENGKTLSDKSFESRSRKLENWFFKEMDKLEAEGKKIEGMSSQELNEELRGKVDRLMKSKYVPKARKNPSPAMQKFQAALKAASEKQHPSFVQRVGKGMLNGVLTAMGGSIEDVQKVKDAYKQYKAYKASRPMKSGKQPTPQYSRLRSVLEKIESAHDKIRNAAINAPSAIKKGFEKAYGGSEPPVSVGNNGGQHVGQTGSSEAPRKKLNALRRMHGTMNNLSSPEAQTLIDDLESEYANATTTKDKMAVMKQFLSLQGMMGGRADYNEDENGNVKRPKRLKDIDGLTQFERRSFDKMQSKYAESLEKGDEDALKVIEDMYKELADSKRGLEGFNSAQE